MILVVDDQPNNLKLLLSFLNKYDFDVRIANSGAGALRVLETEKPNLILLDVMMPIMNGFETCIKIKENEIISGIPIIFITALDNIEDKAMGFEVGGVDYITKPFQHVEVLARIKTHIALRKKELELEKALLEIKKLSKILPICSFCKSIRNDDGYWQQVDEYITEHSETQFSHSLCDKCAKEHYGELLME
jgi:DNA-binding response OmpR family regulator